MILTNSKHREIHTEYVRVFAHKKAIGIVVSKLAGAALCYNAANIIVVQYSVCMELLYKVKTATIMHRPTVHVCCAHVWQGLLKLKVSSNSQSSGGHYIIE